MRNPLANRAIKFLAGDDFEPGEHHSDAVMQRLMTLEVFEAGELTKAQVRLAALAAGWTQGTRGTWVKPGKANLVVQQGPTILALPCVYASCPHCHQGFVLEQRIGA